MARQVDTTAGRGRRRNASSTCDERPLHILTRAYPILSPRHQHPRAASRHHQHRASSTKKERKINCRRHRGRHSSSTEDIVPRAWTTHHEHRCFSIHQQNESVSRPRRRIETRHQRIRHPTSLHTSTHQPARKKSPSDRRYARHPLATSHHNPNPNHSRSHRPAQNCCVHSQANASHSAVVQVISGIATDHWVRRSVHLVKRAQARVVGMAGFWSRRG